MLAGLGSWEGEGEEATGSSQTPMPASVALKGQD
jgi:hypothetical protein